jgi:hypothetical protein
MDEKKVVVGGEGGGLERGKGNVRIKSEIDETTVWMNSMYG